MADHPIFTVGHSTKPISEFVTLLHAGGVREVVDIRTVPRSRTNPQYNLDALPEALKPFQIRHHRLADLGGLRKKSGVPSEVNGFWLNQSFHNYADYALSDQFRRGLEELIAIANQRCTAIMCAEAVWWRCHRRIVADYLLTSGMSVFHLMGDDKVSPATLTVGAVPAIDGLHYPAVPA